MSIVLRVRWNATCLIMQTMPRLKELQHSWQRLQMSLFETSVCGQRANLIVCLCLCCRFRIYFTYFSSMHPAINAHINVILSFSLMTFSLMQSNTDYKKYNNIIFMFPMSHFFQLPFLVLSLLLFLPPQPPSLHAAPLPTPPPPCRPHTDCPTPCHPSQYARVSEVVVQNPRLLLCWRRRLRLRQRQQLMEHRRALPELALRLNWPPDHTRREGPSLGARWDVTRVVICYATVQWPCHFLFHVLWQKWFW